ncbi:hypothetical protein [Haloactinomyces albus]|uniref:Cytochrome c oxidase assembly factor CtaG n=1 Tax=Haloactinomyces albus TaxID=1352928 RepID=A0AAE3ZEC1_9ACTN|nr:hypothetical protein [Haloactinomyces albus]MDR7301439.1 cytochrome c oxidase assembly factor CtaG [Haloactinomyces albus]
MSAHMVHMAMMGLLVSVAAPTLLLVLARIAPRLDRWTVPAAVVLPGFVLLHAAVTVWDHSARLPPLLDAAMPVAMLGGAVLFWAPVLGARHRLPDTGRTLYLYTAMPLLDLAGVWLVVVGDSAGGLSMIAGMLPLGVIAVVVTWNWIHREERRAVAEEPAHSADGPAYDTAALSAVEGGTSMGVHTRTEFPPREGRARGGRGREARSRDHRHREHRLQDHRHRDRTW